MITPSELIDPEGEGIYLSEDSSPGVLLRAAMLFHGDWRLWREVEARTVWMRPKKDSDEWEEVSIGRFPYGWWLNLPARWRPVRFVYCTPLP